MAKCHHKRVSKGLCEEGTRSHTYWGWNYWMRGWAACFMMKGLDHIPPEHSTRVQKVQQWILWWKHHITYILRAEHGWKGFSSGFCDERTRSRTHWGQNMGAKSSAVDFVMKAPDHIPTEGRTWVQKVQQSILWWKHHITYFLRAEHGCKRFSSQFCDESTRSHTHWGQNMGANGSAVDFVVKVPDHIHAKDTTQP